RDDHIADDFDRVTRGDAKFREGVGVLGTTAVEGEGGDADIAKNRRVAGGRREEQIGRGRSRSAQILIVRARVDDGVSCDVDGAAVDAETGYGLRKADLIGLHLRIDTDGIEGNLA